MADNGLSKPRMIGGILAFGAQEFLVCMTNVRDGDDLSCVTTPLGIGGCGLALGNLSDIFEISDMKR